MNRKGQPGFLIVGFMVAIIGFILAGFVLYDLFKDDSLANRDLCRVSVLSRATVPTAGQSLVPLNCQPEKICITVDGKDNDCKQFSGYKNVRKVELKISESSVNNAKAVETIQREVANAMYDCWLMTGQGKLSIFPPGNSEGVDWGALILDNAGLTISEINPKCIICSRIAFSDKLYEEDKKYEFLKTVDINNFMSTQNVPGTGQSYTDTFTNGGVGGGYGLIAQSESSSQGLKGYNDLAIIFAQIKVSNIDANKAFWDTFLNGAILGGATAFTGPGSVVPISKPLQLLLVAGVSTVLAYEAEEAATKNQAISSFVCRDFESTSEEQQRGCSLVRLMEWDVKNINSLCSSIEGNL